MSRAVEEWIGKTDDAPAPPRVKLRILHRQDFKCALTGREIKASDRVEFDHIKELILGGQNRESNLQAVLPEPHKQKTKAAMKRRAKADAVAKQAFGLKADPPRKIESRGFQKSSGKHSATTEIVKLAGLPRRGLYQ